MKNFIQLAFIAFSLLFIPFISSAEDFENIRIYPAYWRGVAVGDLIIKIKDKGSEFQVETYIRSKGVVKSISGYSGDTVTLAKVSNGKVTPISFDSAFDLKGKPRHIIIKYNDMGEIVHEENTPAEDRDKRPEVEAAGKKDALDPLTIALLVREKLKELRATSGIGNSPVNFSIPMYDGRRRSDLKFTIYGHENIKIMGKETPAIHISFINEPVAGYTHNEIRNLPTQNPVINAYISDDDLLLPLKGDGQTRIGFASGELEKECREFKGCGIEY